jgi:hypothetical protein
MISARSVRYTEVLGCTTRRNSELARGHRRDFPTAKSKVASQALWRLGYFWRSQHRMLQCALTLTLKPLSQLRLSWEA